METRDLPNEPFAAGNGPRFLDRTLDGLRRAPARVTHFVFAYWAWSLAALCAIVASVIAAPGASGVLGSGLAIVMILIAAIDARSFVIPNKLVLAGLTLGLVDAALARPGQFAANLVTAALRGLLIALLFLGFRFAYRYIRGREGLGLGDVKLAAVAGVWLGWMAAAFAVDIAALSALAAVLIGALRGHKIAGTTRVPFGLFFAPAIWAAWLIEAMLFRGTA